MPNMEPDRLSEVELYKIIAELQWLQIGERLGVPTQKILNEAGERLYGSVVHFSIDFGDDSLGQFVEGATVHLAGSVQFFAQNFLEGWTFFSTDASKLDEERIAQVNSWEEARSLGLPVAYMVNAFVARQGSNQRLKTFMPATYDPEKLPMAPCRPKGLDLHQDVLRGGEIEKGWPTDLALERSAAEPVPYLIDWEDYNGAGLLYFARFPGIMGRAERHQMQSSLFPVPVSKTLLSFTAPKYRTTFFFSNANEGDVVETHSRVGVRRCSETRGPRGATFVQPLEFVFEHALYRASDNALLCRSQSSRLLTLPKKIKSLRAEVHRLESHLAPV